MTDAKVITVCAPMWNVEESYGRIANELRNHALKRGYTVNTLGAGAPNRSFELAFGGIFLAYPTHYADYGMIANVGAKVAVTMFESDELPEGWVEVLNTFKAVIVPTHWCKDVFQRSGVTAPIEVVPLGISEAYQYVERPIEVPDDYVHRFVAIGLGNSRKNSWDLCSAFYEAFHDDPRYKLTFKNRPTTEDNKLKSFTADNIDLYRADLSDVEMAQFYAGFDYMVFPSHGEGFGLPPREFAATGGISIATDYSGLSDDLDTWGVSIPTSGLEEAWTLSPTHTGLGRWARIEISFIAASLKFAVSLREPMMRRSAARAEQTRLLYNWDNFVDKVLKIWES